jgi:CheY-like chemotaxis protein
MVRHTPRVLVVDDDDGIRKFAERALGEGGYDVKSVTNGPDALRLVAREAPYDLFVLDLIMPEMRGDELARRLRLAAPDIHVLYFTGFSDMLFEEKSILWECEAFLEKPVTVRGLREAASLLLYGHGNGPGTQAA